jgi:hypothetical protein
VIRVSLSYWQWLLICWLISPGALIIIGVVGESRLVPLFNPRKQFLSFFPGDLFLGVSVSWLIFEMVRLQPEKWYLSWWWYVILLIIALSIAVTMTQSEYKSNYFPKRAILSPTKIYHNLALYGVYGSIAGFSILAGFFSRHILQTLLAMSPMLCWASMLIIERFLPKNAEKTRRNCAHVADWKPLNPLRFLFK